MANYLCLTLVANQAETEAAFKSRLSAFWTHLLRTQPETYEAVFAEGKEFDSHDGRLARAYMVEAESVDAIAAELAEHGIDALAPDPDDTYSKYEAAGSEWFQIPH